MSSKTILITGASSGIGYALAKLCARHNHRLILCARRKERLEALKKQLVAEHSIECLTLQMDVQDQKQINDHINSLDDSWSNIDVLVNNAGLALGLEGIESGKIEDWETMIDTNIKGLLYMTQAVVKNMLKHNRGHIINIGSISGREVYPGGGVYCATKHAVRALTEAMKKDWHGTPIRVSEVNPGFADTEFSLVRFKQDENRAKKVYENTKALSAEDIADAIYYCLTRPEHVDIREIFITATSQSASHMIYRET